MYFVVILREVALDETFPRSERNILSSFAEKLSCFWGVSVKSLTYSIVQTSSFTKPLLTWTLWSTSFFMSSLIFVFTEILQPAMFLMYLLKRSLARMDQSETDQMQWNQSVSLLRNSHQNVCSFNQKAQNLSEIWLSWCPMVDSSSSAGLRESFSWWTTLLGCSFGIDSWLSLLLFTASSRFSPVSNDYRFFCLHHHWSWPRSNCKSDVNAQDQWLQQHCVLFLYMLLLYALHQ